MTEHNTDAGELLTRIMKTLSLSDRALSDRTNGQASATSVREYRSGQIPRADKAAAVARQLENYGPQLLRAWTYPEAADHLEHLPPHDPEEPTIRATETNTLNYTGRRLNPEEETAILLVLSIIRSQRD